MIIHKLIVTTTDASEKTSSTAARRKEETLRQKNIIIFCDLKLPVRKDSKKLLPTEDTNECSCCTKRRNKALRVTELSLHGAFTKPKTLEET